MSIKEKVAYLQGLADGLGLDSESKEGKLISVIIDTLSDMANEISSLDENSLDLAEEIDAISDDLASLEEFLYDEELDDEDDYDDFMDFDDDEGCGCTFCGGGNFSYEIECPDCGADIEIDDSNLVDGSVVCPSCGGEHEFDFDDDEIDPEEETD